MQPNHQQYLEAGSDKQSDDDAAWDDYLEVWGDGLSDVTLGAVFRHWPDGMAPGVRDFIHTAIENMDLADRVAWAHAIDPSIPTLEQFLATPKRTQPTMVELMIEGARKREQAGYEIDRRNLVQQASECKHYERHWDGPEWNLVRIKHRVAVPAGLALASGDLTIARVVRPTGASMVEAYSARLSMPVYMQLDNIVWLTDGGPRI